MKKRKKRNLLKRAMALLLSAALVISMAGTTPAYTYAAENTEIPGNASGDTIEAAAEEVTSVPVQGQETDTGEEKEETGGEGAGEAASEEQGGGVRPPRMRKQRRKPSAEMIRLKHSRRKRSHRRQTPLLC